MKPSILIVDDEAVIAISWEYLLKDEGYKVKTALNGKEAIETLNDMRPDIVFTDLFMPGMDGIELCKRIKAIYPETEVVLISGNPHQGQDVQKDFINAGGIGDILIKPVSVETLIEIIEDINDKKNKADFL